MGDHASDGAVEDLGGSAVMEGTRLFRVDDVALVEEVVVTELSQAIQFQHFPPFPRLCTCAHLVPEEAARNVDLLAPHHNDFLPIEDLLRDDGGQSSKEVTLAINDDGSRRECGHVCPLFSNAETAERSNKHT